MGPPPHAEAQTWMITNLLYATTSCKEIMCAAYPLNYAHSYNNLDNGCVDTYIGFCKTGILSLFSHIIISPVDKGTGTLID